ncbi:hypothetical protein DC083_04030 [Ignatzschineria ureiclastica]|uniref:Cytoskeleton protein RodZ-like C-terminal domain-containing protein n=1 Tax=Ignatzschineria ureiclastica TaxID=472582 RepID=A0A2U2AEJ1_9GAMM|nr:helix-turn-helix domain-containing protein [Ignatzschineria ureiclastica]PWD81078.1 hypothetical protein DC083_04030 [Ignatzschineria ureiclastica]GGZ96059.1 hypothetical protein GCM10007162_10130 [Ignatzschineria ureiclastica]
MKERVNIAQQLGEVLKNARLDKSLSIEEVSRVLSLRPSLVAAMESGDYQEIGALLYAKNYLRKYAKFLGLLDENFEAELSRLTEKVDTKSQTHHNSAKVKQEAEEKKRSNHFKYYLIFVLALIAIFAYLYQNGMIPALFKEMRALDTKENVSLLNERFPSIELEYGIPSNQDNVSFENLLIDSVEGEQVHNRKADELYQQELNSAVDPIANAWQGEGIDTTVGKSEISSPLQTQLGDDSQQQRGQQGAVSRQGKKTGTGRFNALGQSLQHYDALLSGNALPVMNLGAQSVGREFIAPNHHLLYPYSEPNKVHYGVAVDPAITAALTAQFNQKISFFDRESGFYPALDQLVTQFQLERAEAELAAIAESIKVQEDAIREAMAEEAVSEITIELMNLELQKLIENLELSEKRVEALQQQLPQKVAVNIVADDITTLDITDMNGRVVTSRVMAPGEQYQLEGDGVYDIYLGNPAVIDKITVNGKAIPEYYYRPFTDEVASVRFSLNSVQYQ